MNPCGGRETDVDIYVYGYYKYAATYPQALRRGIWTMRKSLWIILAVVFATFGATVAHADTAYVYQGNPFTGFSGNYQCPPQCGMLGFFIVATPLAPDMTGGGGQFQFNVTPLAYV